MTAKTVRSKQRWWILAAVSAFMAIGLMRAVGMGATEGASKPAAAGAPEQKASSAISSAQTSKVELVQPTVKLPPNGKATLLLLMRNTGAGALHNVRVTPVINAEIALESAPPFDRAQDVVPNGEFVWTITVSNKGEDLASGGVIFRLDYTQGGEAAKPVPQVAYAVLQVTGNESADVAEVKMESTLESLDQQHPGKVYLLVKNKSEHSLTVRTDKITWYKPSFVKITLDGPNGDQGKRIPVDLELKLSPNQMQVIPFEVGTLSRVQPGKHLLVATVPLDSGGVPHGRSRNITVTQEVQVGVIGESALLKLLAIPSFLVIPGFIALIIWGLLWKWGLLKSKRDTGSFPVEFADNPITPQFWVIAVTISIPVIAAYALIVNRDLLGNYGLSDLIYIWMFSVLLLGIGGYLLIIGGYKYYLGRITPSEKDEPIDILRKLERQGLGICLDQAEFTATEQGDQKIRRGFLLQKPDRDTIWVGPTILVRWEKTVDSKIKEEVDAQRGMGGNPGKLLDFLEKAGKTATVDWKIPTEDSKEIGRPREIPTASMNVIGVDCIVEVA